MGQRCCKEYPSIEQDSAAKSVYYSIPESVSKSHIRELLVNASGNQASGIYCCRITSPKITKRCLRSTRIDGPRMTQQNIDFIKPTFADDESNSQPEYGRDQEIFSKIEKAFKLIDSENKGSITSLQLTSFLIDQLNSGVSTAEDKSWPSTEINHLVNRFSTQKNESWTILDFSRFMRTKFQ